MKIINEIKLTFSDMINVVKASFTRCNNCGEHLTYKNHHITKNGFWHAEFYCMSCGEKQ